MAPDVDQAAVLHAGGTGRFAIAAGQATVQVQLGLGSDGLAFEHLLDQINAPARAVEFIAEQLIGRTGGGAKAAMHALAQDVIAACGLGIGKLSQGEVGLHTYGLSGRGVSVASASNCFSVASAF